jgi:hypothetical protein
MAGLTRKQRSLIREIEEIMSLERLDHSRQDVERYRPEWRTAHLARIRDHYVRSTIIMDYVWIDEQMSALLCHYFFGRERTFIQLWRTRKFQNFNYFVLERLYLSQKLDLAKSIQRGIPRQVENAMRKLNDLRNGLAHSFFPQNRRQPLPQYGGHGIYSLQGFKAYRDEIIMVEQYLVRRQYGRRYFPVQSGPGQSADMLHVVKASACLLLTRRSGVSVRERAPGQRKGDHYAEGGRYQQTE